MLLDLKFTNRETLFEHVKPGDSLGCCHDEKVELMRRVGKKKKKEKIRSHNHWALGDHDFFLPEIVL